MDDAAALDRMAELCSQMYDTAKKNEAKYGSRENGEKFAKKRRDPDGLTSSERSRFYKAIDNNEKGLLVGEHGVLLFDDSPTDPYVSDYT